MKRTTELKELLAFGGVALGLIVTEFRTPHLGAMLDVGEIDFMVFDMEHGTFSYETMSDMIAALHGRKVAPVVRLPEIRKECITKALDSGAQGLLVPGVETVEQVKTVVRYAKYAPMGERGVSLRKPHTDFLPPNRAEYTRWANEQTLIMIQVETANGIANLEDLVKVEGVDLIFIGPSDLAHSLSPHSDDAGQALVEDAINHILEICKRNNRYVGIHMSDPNVVASLIEKGVQLVTVGTDASIFIDACRAKVRQIREIRNSGKTD